MLSMIDLYSLICKKYKYKRLCIGMSMNISSIKKVIFNSLVFGVISGLVILAGCESKQSPGAKEQAETARYSITFLLKKDMFTSPVVIAKGSLVLPVLNGQAGQFEGAWRVQGAGTENVDDPVGMDYVAPLSGEGQLRGNLTKEQCFIDLSPGWIDDNVKLILPSSVQGVGRWEYVTYIGVSSSGVVRVTRDDDEDQQLSKKVNRACFKEFYERTETTDDNGNLIVECRIGDRLMETTWYSAGWPVMRTKWHSNGYGHVFEFSSNGLLLAISEAIFGTKNGLEIRFDEIGQVVNLARFANGKELKPEEFKELPDPPDELEVREHVTEGTSGMYVSLSEYLQAGQLVESRWYHPDSKLAIRSVFDESGYGLALFFRANGSIRLIGEVKYNLFDGLAWRVSAEGEQSSKYYVNGTVVGSR